MSIFLDLILIAVLILAFFIGSKKGFVKSVWKIAALVITIVMVLMLKTPAVNFLSGTNLANVINTKISENISIPQGGGVNIAGNLNLPLFLQSDLNTQMDAAQGLPINDMASASLTSLFITIIALVGLFIIIRLALMLVFMIITAVTELPLIKGINKLVGGLLAVINVVFIVYLLLAVVSLLAPADSALFENIDNTYIVKYLYNYNILLQLFMKI